MPMSKILGKQLLLFVTCCFRETDFKEKFYRNYLPINS